MDDERLIEAVREREFLYNLQHARYTDYRYKNIAWKEIAEEVQQPVSVCKSRWQNIRDSYRKFRARQNAMQSGQAVDGTSHKPYRLGSSLDFLNKHFKERTMLSSIRGYPETPSTEGMLIGTSQQSDSPNTRDMLHGTSPSPSFKWEMPNSQATVATSTTTPTLFSIGSVDEDPDSEENRQRAPTRKRRKIANDDSAMLRNFGETNRMLHDVFENPDSQLKLLAKSVIAGMEQLDFRRQMIAKRKLNELALLVDDLLIEKYNEEQTNL